jgi:lambda family phage portal protein
MRPPRKQTFQEGWGGMRADYAAMNESRFRRTRSGLAPMGGGADYHYSNESKFLRLIEYARDMMRNDAIVPQMVRRAVANTIQDGMKLDVSTGNGELNDLLTNLWADWSTNPSECDVKGEHTFRDMERLALQQTIVDGDVFALPLQTGQLQMVEAHRLRTPSNTSRNVINGILHDDSGKAVEYWITKLDVDTRARIAKVSDIQQYKAWDSEGNRQVFHMYVPDRYSQSRGVTAFAPVFDVMGMFDDINFAKLVQQQVASCITFLRTFSAAGDGSVSPEQALGAAETRTLADGASQIIEELQPGLSITGRPGESIEGFSPQIPNQGFFEHVKLMLQIVGCNIGMPLVLLLLDASQTNFSGWRGAVDQARLGFRANQRCLIDKFHRHVYQWKVRQWIADNPRIFELSRLKGVKPFGHKWNPPAWPYIEPKTDAEADIVKAAGMLTSRTRIHAERGQDYYTIVDETMEETLYLFKKAAESSQAHNKAFPDAITTFRDFLPERISIAITSNAPAPNPTGRETANNANAS